jgi:hypothetical protein
MLSLVDAMNDKLSLLNQVDLDKVDRKLKMLSLELDDIARSEEKTGLPAHQEKKVPWAHLARLTALAYIMRSGFLWFC